MINAVIIEDERHGLDNLKNLLSKYCPQVSVIGDAGSVESGIELFSSLKEKINVAFLDINLPDGLVFQLLNSLPKIDFEVIFVTGHEKFAIKACNYSSIGYVLKPIDPDQLVEAVSRVKTADQQQASKMEERVDMFSQYYHNPNKFEKMSIAALDGIYFINIKDVVRLEGEDNYTHIFMKAGNRLTASKTIKSYEEMLAGVNFYRVHKSHLVNLNYLKKFVKGDGGYIIMDDDKQIAVSRRRRAAFMEQMKKLQEEI